MPTYNDAPIYSTGRLVFDLTENHYPIFDHAYSQNKGNITLFSYAQKDPASEAGYDPATSGFISRKHTNIIRKGELPGGARGAFSGMAVTFGLAMKPIDQAATGNATTQAKATSADSTKFVPVPDATGVLQTTLVKLFCEAYTPFLQYGSDGEKEYLPSVKLLGSGKEVWDGRSGVISGAPYMFKADRVWSPSGANANLRVGFEVTNPLVTQAYAEAAADATSSLGAALRALASYPAAAANAGAGPAHSGDFVLAMDVKVLLIGDSIAADAR